MTNKIIAPMGLVIAGILLGSIAVVLAQETKPAPIDWPKAQLLYQKSLAGEALNPEESAILDRAKAELAAGRGPGANAGGPAGGANSGGTPLRPPSPSTGFIPLNQMTAQDRYQGEDGGLYGGGINTPPKEQLAAATAAVKKIVPLGQDGKPAANGKIVLMSVGMSNTSMEFLVFKQNADKDAAKNPKLVVVNAAQGSMTAHDWTVPNGSVWKVAQKNLQDAGVSPAQVQAIWLKQAIAGPAPLGDFPKHAQQLKQWLIEDIQQILKHYPNARIIYMSSRTYGGYALRMGNPEPYAYGSAFAVRWVIEDQIKGLADLNDDPAKGEVKAPVLLWGPYLWTDGTQGRKCDGVVWNKEDVNAEDGIHPTSTACDKVSQLLLDFFKTDPTAKTWFVKSGS